MKHRREQGGLSAPTISKVKPASFCGGSRAWHGFFKRGERSFIFFPKEELFPFWPRSLLEQHGLGVASLLWALCTQSSCLLLCVGWVCLFCSAWSTQPGALEVLQGQPGWTGFPPRDHLFPGWACWSHWRRCTVLGWYPEGLSVSVQAVREHRWVAARTQTLLGQRTPASPLTFSSKCPLGLLQLLHPPSSCSGTAWGPLHPWPER